MDPQKKDAFFGWAKFLNPESLKGNLIAASLFLAAYETLKSSIIEQIRRFFKNGFDQNGLIVDADYQTKVLSLDKSALRASLLWLKEHGVIREDDLKLIDEIREHRNELAHDLSKFITDANAGINVRLLGCIYELVTKIDRWWVLEVELPTDPDFDDQEVDAEGIHSGNMLFLQMMIHVATGEDSSAYWDEFQRLSSHSHQGSNGPA